MITQKLEKEQVVKFQYKKSNGEVSDRIVVVKAVDNDSFGGEDLTAKGYRSFKVSKAQKLKVLAGSKDDILPVLSNARNSPVTGEELARVASDVWQEYYSNVEYVKEIDSLVMTHLNKIRVQVDHDPHLNNGFITFILDGKHITLDVNARGEIRDILVGKESVGNDINAFIGALEGLEDA